MRSANSDVPALRVLLVDDEPSILFVLERILASRGWEVLTASSGTEALGLVERADALLTDMCMPGLNGIELIRALRTRGLAIPAILLTADLSPAVASRAFAAGADRCMEKPFRIDELFACIDGALASRGRAGGASRSTTRAELAAA